ncbi:hypothetical protein C7S20_18425 [Christiangramia fulva]|uniref:Uncharacterized protein n=1 Tax=Christiangramia fulva TaxID=2126553 RepID=A0A2R3ZA35_9FLAO|nr:hypothetical protein [Christiangramia fulva]AVR47064.1 hypothetical protein C7S20_18425 [Christiangramia fulva]
MSKIKNYNRTIENVKDFEIVEVSVPEEWIKEIKVEDILQNPEKFQELSANFSSTMQETSEDPELELNDKDQVDVEVDEFKTEEDEPLELKLKDGKKSDPELDFPEGVDPEIEEFEEEDFEDYKTNR